MARVAIITCGGNDNQVVATIVLLFYLMYPTIITYFTELISCTGFIGDRQYLKLDPKKVSVQDKSRGYDKFSTAIIKSKKKSYYGTSS